MSTTANALSMRTCIVVLLCYLLAASLLGTVSAQSTPSGSQSVSATPQSSPSLSVSVSTGSITVTTITHSANRNVPITTVIPALFNVTLTVTPSTTSSAPTNTSSASSTPTPTPIVLATTLDPAFGVLGAILIITGLPSAFWGHKNRWTSFFLIGFYTLSLVCIILIIKFGILAAVNPPTKTLRGMFVLASGIAGVAGGGVAIFFWKAARYFIGAWGGFAFGLWLQCFHNGGVIKAIGLRWILYIGCAVIGFVLCTIPKIHYHVLLVSTAFVGASAFMLGVDCFTTAGLKEFYIWNLGFRALFPKFTNNGIQFPVSQTMQIELGLIGAVALMGIAVQLRILTVLQRKLREIQEEQRKQDEEAESHATQRFAAVLQERDEWERQHPSLAKHGRNESNYSNTPLMKEQDSPITAERRSSTFTLVGDGHARPRYNSGVSDFFAAPTPTEDLRRAARNPQSPGVLPVLDLGLGIQEDVPNTFIAAESAGRSALSSAELEELKRKEELLAEIQTIRRSIDALKAETPVPSSSSESRRPSLNSRRTLSIDAGNALLPSPSHLRPPREIDPRARVQSMELTNLARSAEVGQSIGRPISAPLRDNDWDSYVYDRKLIQPPTGVTPPIATSPRMPVPQAVTEALAERKRRESAMERSEHGRDSSSDDIPVAALVKMQKKNSPSTGNVPVTILPPRKPTSPIVSPTPQRPEPSRTRTFEELNERHREKMRDLQAPLAQAEKERANLEAARQRWERSKALEKEAVTRRQAEKAAMQQKRKMSDDDPERSGRRSTLLDEPRASRHSRSLSADKLAVMGTSSKRLSTLKVSDWQKYQQSTEAGGSPTDRVGGSGKRLSQSPKADDTTVPFPKDGTKTRSGNGRGRVNLRDPLN